MQYHYSQRDPKWGELYIGKSGLKMKNFGCVVTSCAMMLSDFFKREITPKELLEFLNKQNGFDNLGRIYWDRISDFGGGALRHRKKKWLSKEKEYCLRQMVWGRFNHWVLMLNSTVYVDPWDGKEKTRQENKPNQWTGYSQFYAGTQK